MAVITAYKARKMYLSGKVFSHKELLHKCKVAGEFVEDSLTYNTCKQQSNLALVSINKMKTIKKTITIIKL